MTITPPLSWLYRCRSRERSTPSTITSPSSLPPIRRGRPNCSGSGTLDSNFGCDVFREGEVDEEVVAGDEPQFVEGALFFFSLGGLADLTVVVFHESGGGGVECSGLAEDITGVDHTAEVLLVETAFISRVGVDDAEGEASEGVPKFGDVGRDVAKGCQDFAKCSVLPEKIL